MPVHRLPRACGHVEYVAVSEHVYPDRVDALGRLCVDCAAIGQRQRIRRDADGEPQERPNFEPTLDAQGGVS
ncbi:hypothetical protein LCGC14_2595220 [marine sediment metagenome]|uniref:Uncharacterized protein n=1 Tax=marine sediment metagenome TaxID=412755 RepID=A0A0F9AYC4_9ZZZZ